MVVVVWSLRATLLPTCGAVVVVEVECRVVDVRGRPRRIPFERRVLCLASRCHTSLESLGSPGPSHALTIGALATVHEGGAGLAGSQGPA